MHARTLGGTNDYSYEYKKEEESKSRVCCNEEIWKVERDKPSTYNNAASNLQKKQLARRQRSQR
jgi:hypothetical protein